MDDRYVPGRLIVGVRKGKVVLGLRNGSQLLNAPLTADETLKLILTLEEGRRQIGGAPMGDPPPPAPEVEPRIAIPSLWARLRARFRRAHAAQVRP